MNKMNDKEFNYLIRYLSQIRTDFTGYVLMIDFRMNFHSGINIFKQCL